MRRQRPGMRTRCAHGTHHCPGHAGASGLQPALQRAEQSRTDVTQEAHAPAPPGAASPMDDPIADPGAGGIQRDEACTEKTAQTSSGSGPAQQGGAGATTARRAGRGRRAGVTHQRAGRPGRQRGTWRAPCGPTAGPHPRGQTRLHTGTRARVGELDSCSSSQQWRAAEQRQEPSPSEYSLA